MSAACSGKLVRGARGDAAAIEQLLLAVDDDLIAWLEAAGDDDLGALGDIDRNGLGYDIVRSSVAAASACAGSAASSSGGRG
jgi:hypothetical protein